MPPKRKRGKDLPDNLYVSFKKGVAYYSYKDTRPGGTSHGMGTCKDAAVKDAKELNAAIALQLQQSRVAKVTEAKPETPRLSAVILKHLELEDQRHMRGKIAASTIKNKRGYSDAIRRALGDKPIGEVSVRDVVVFLDSYADKTGAAKVARSEFVEIFKTAMHLGYVAVNTPALTRPIERECKRARLSLEQWPAIRKSADELEPWLGLSMDLAMVSGQRLERIAAIEFRPHADAMAWVADGMLWILPHKRGNPVCIPLTLRLESLGLELGEVVARCRDTILSRYLLHARRNNGTSMRGDQVGAHALSTAFKKARDLSGIVWPEGKTPPTFHEQRSTSAREYTAQGNIDVQALLGHKDAATTAIYKDSRGSEWCYVKTC